MAAVQDRAVPAEVLRELRRIPGVGKSIAADLHQLGISEVAELRGRDPEELYEQFCELSGARVDRCLLYVFRCAVYFAGERNPDPEKLKWWNWKDGQKITSKSKR